MKKKSKTTSKQKKDGLIIAVLSVVALFMLVFCINAVKEDEPSVPEVTGTTTTSAPVTTTTQPPQTTTAPSVTETTAPADTTVPADTTAPTQAPTETTTAVTDEKEAILKVVSDGVNALKASDASFKGHKVQNINIQLVDSSVPYMNNFVNSIIKAFVKEEIFDYDFTNGIADDPESDGTVDTINTFPPGDKPFELTKEGVASATKTADGENTVYTVVIVPEKSTLENPRPPHHNAGADTLDLSSVEIPIATITKVDFDYPGAEISVTLDPDGKVVGYHEHLKIRGTGEASGLGISGYGTIEGYIDEKWDIEWK